MLALQSRVRLSKYIMYERENQTFLHFRFSVDFRPLFLTQSLSRKILLNTAVCFTFTSVYINRRLANEESVTYRWGVRIAGTNICNVWRRPKEASF